MLPLEEGKWPPEFHWWVLVSTSIALAAVLNEKGIITFDEISRVQTEMYERLERFMGLPEEPEEE